VIVGAGGGFGGALAQAVVIATRLRPSSRVIRMAALSLTSYARTS
jgi:hypothetical protein